ncbi:MAG: rhamnulokinase family protein [Christensenella sp.]|nr:rhamnulokinase family protein [Christensenella sp.]
MKKKRLLAFDLGASNGRAVLGAFDGARVELSEVHRFDNPMVEQNGLYYWDALGLYRNLKESFLKLKHDGLEADCFGIDTWGVDFGLIDKNGALLGNPRCYRNGTEAQMALVHGVVPQQALFSRTGIASMPFNTVYQLYARVQEADPALQHAETLLFSPDLYGYFFTGERQTEYTIATTSMLYDGERRRWDEETMRMFGIPKNLFTSVDFAGTLRGKIREAVAEELGISRVPFAAVGTHDTASAVAAIPGEGSFAFCSSGTWSLFGVETEKPVKSSAVLRANFSNEGTVQGTFRLLKNIMGLWLVQECRRDWQKQGIFLSYDEIDEQARQSEGLVSIIDTDDLGFYAAGNMQRKIQDYCARTNQPVPQTVGQVARCIYDSLALKYRYALETLETFSGARIDRLNIVGGGTKNKLMNQLAADATGRTVIAGPVESACVGNLLLQAVALGELGGVEDARAVVRASFATERYESRHSQQWEDAYGRLRNDMEMKQA